MDIGNLKGSNLADTLYGVLPIKVHNSIPFDDIFFDVANQLTFSLGEHCTL